MDILLRHWRERRGYSVRTLAEHAKVGFSTVTKIENGHMSPTVETLERLAKALGIRVRDLFPTDERARKRPRKAGQ
jgi:transcriptional regulator with XRE-family HTH domain